jgi:hypothetical protein
MLFLKRLGTPLILFIILFVLFYVGSPPNAARQFTHACHAQPCSPAAVAELDDRMKRALEAGDKGYFQ